MISIAQAGAGAVILSISVMVAPSVGGLAFLVLGGLALVSVATIDLVEHRIPNGITYPMMGCCLVAGTAATFNGDASRAFSGVVGAVLFGAALLGPHAWKNESMGLGDVKLAVPLGFAIGWVHGDASTAASAICWTILVACVLGLVQATTRWSGSADERFVAVSVPFGPALSVAGWGAVAFTLAQH